MKNTPTPTARRRKGGSSNPIVFHDYASYVAKFQLRDSEKTTDETYTPQDVYEAILQYVGTICPLDDKEILRPFYPGGDYQNAEYPQDGIVIDNPPFSIFSQIVRFYTANHIPFFLFGPGMTIMNVLPYCTAVIISRIIRFDNGAQISINFATNLLPDDILVTTAKQLDRHIALCPSQQTPRKLPKYDYPRNLLSVSTLQTLCRNDGEDISILRHQAHHIRRLDHKDLYGDHLIISDKIADKIADKEKVEFSDREKQIVEKLNRY